MTFLLGRTRRRPLSQDLDQEDPRVDRRRDEDERGADQNPIDAAAASGEETHTTDEDGQYGQEELREGSRMSR